MNNITCNSPNTFRYYGKVSRLCREKMNGHKSAVFWFTGLSGSGKSTIAHMVEAALHGKNIRTYVFDGDNVRHGLCRDLGFSEADRSENIRRVGEMVKLFTDAGILCLTAFISPLRKDRDSIRQVLGEQDFFEIYVRCPLEVCEKRDVKGLYKLAREGKIKNYTGISAPYESPENADLVIDTDKLTKQECVNQVLEFIRLKEISHTGEQADREPVLRIA